MRSRVTISAHRRCCEAIQPPWTITMSILDFIAEAWLPTSSRELFRSKGMTSGPRSRHTTTLSLSDIVGALRCEVMASTRVAGVDLGCTDGTVGTIPVVQGQPEWTGHGGIFLVFDRPDGNACLLPGPTPNKGTATCNRAQETSCRPLLSLPHGSCLMTSYLLLLLCLCLEPDPLSVYCRP